ncbi:hypothetical protein [Brachyspira aalborgi]|uniref:Uncharacterized protein n=1 Tax=Brachyspira aalborgi TaxID=29522 RepID=A0A5C8FKW5_9SPIR|nr:hypothetical protein [Brachyspira aalborgi]TXJ50339.1 hypothetical protein EPJ84_06300 [Brachyspira aalborgi]
MSEIIISKKLVDSLKKKSENNNEFKKLFEFALKFNNYYQQKDYKNFVINLRECSDYVSSIYRVDYLKDILTSALWNEVSGLHNALHSMNYLDEYIKSFDDIMISRDFANSSLHTEFNKNEFYIDENNLPNKNSINILIQIGLFGIDYIIENINTKDLNEISLETVFDLPTENDYNNYKQKNNIKSLKGLEDIYLDYIINNENNDFLDKYYALRIAKYIWDCDFISVREIVKNELEKISNSKKDNRYYQLLLANSIVDMECNKIKEAKNSLKIILSKCNLNYLNDIADNILTMLGEFKYLDNQINYYNVKKPLNLPNYNNNITNVLYDDFIKAYSGSISLSVIDYKYYILSSNIRKWLNVYIKFISLGLFNNINSHYEILLKEQIIQYGIYKYNNGIMMHVFFILLKSNIPNNSLIDKTVLIIEDMISNKDIENIKIYLDLLIKNSIVSSAGIKFIIKYIYLLDKKQLEILIKKREEWFNKFVNNNERSIKDLLNLELYNSHLDLYIAILKISKEVWDKEKYNIIELIENKKNYIIRINSIIDIIIYQLFPIYKDTIDNEYIEKWISFLNKLYKDKEMHRFLSTQNAEIDLKYKVILTFSNLDRKIDKKYLKEYFDISFYLYYESKTLPNISKDNIKHLYERCEKYFIEFKNSTKYVEDSDIAYLIYNLLIITKKYGYFFNESKKLLNNFLEYFCNQNHIIFRFGVLISILVIVLEDYNSEEYKDKLKINILELIDSNIIEKYSSYSNWNDIIENSYSLFYSDKSKGSINDIIKSYFDCISSIINNTELGLLELNRLSNILWHQYTVRHALALLIHFHKRLKKEYMPTLQIQIIKWIVNLPLNISLSLIKIYKYIYRNDLESINKIKEMHPEINIQLLNELNKKESY